MSGGCPRTALSKHVSESRLVVRVYLTDRTAKQNAQATIQVKHNMRICSEKEGDQSVKFGLDQPKGEPLLTITFL